MSEATTKVAPGRTHRIDAVEARHWIERQLQWERTLGSLRNGRSQLATRRAA
ncbi:MAG: hypothetical protein ACXVKQ_12380 [Acidimicrobiia bacterium]